MKISLDGMRALVTGANSGIGQAIAQGLGRAGAKVGINYITHPEAAEQVVRGIGAQKALALQADVTDERQVQAMFGKLDQAWGGVDVLVNCAGIDGQREFGWEADAEAWRRVIEVNLFGAFNCAREALKRMVAQKSGVVLNVTSVHEVIPWSGYSAYTASKAGLAMLTKTLAQEAAPHGVRVLAIAPGAIRTPINQEVWGDHSMLDDLLAKIPEGRMGSVEDVADVAVLLASDAARYMTGSSVFVDGGMTLFPSFTHGG
jgi:NAD(P)-dependent dehydrogenase (short-subunit alcohol dehydrogenase family)